MRMQNLNKITIYIHSEEENAYVHKIVSIFVNALDNEDELLKIDPLLDEIGAAGLGVITIMSQAALIFEGLINKAGESA